ncbi:hypothetical protein IE53DRAFT_383765 [Violaceomyces palustris]|uniref:Uncharacterized protein n=1 Tax=Violaceomyces palustris TaxID=1673888 RepID=A0ACD0P6M0_9BASI|nr:hypothetical protein IE53DRAFT_383765 [Violaceomyces palustris]
MSSIANKLAQLLSLGRPQYSKLGFKLLDHDPILEQFRSWGFKVVEYDLPPYPLALAGIISVRMLSFIVGSAVVAYFLYHKVAVRSPLLNWVCILSLIGALMSWPLLTGMSGVMLLDFWRPALGFRSSMLVWDIFRIRTREEVNSWSFARFFAQLWTFPKELDEIEERTREEGFERDARIENLKGMPKVAVEAIAMLFCLYFIPPYELTKDMSQIAYHAYCDTLGLTILMTLALFGDGLLKALGILINVEMADMFENPLGTTNIRLFWSHWNRAIATVLHRVVFGGGKAKISLKAKKKKALEDSAAAEAIKKRRHLDHLSETEVEQASAEEDEKSGGRKGLRSSGLKPLSQVNGDSELRKRKQDGGADGATPSKKPQERGESKTRSKSKFSTKAAAAILTFAMSGIFHEHITYFTLGFANGENFLFFLANGVATVASTWFRRTYPEINSKIPTLASVLMLHAFFFAVIPLFCSPFIRSGFFIQLDALKYELLPFRERPRGSFIYLFGK